MNGEIKSLTGIRGVAAVYVILYHIMHYSTKIQFIKNGYIAVDLFFVLSGFIMTYTYKKQFIQSVSPANFLIFMNHRFSRIWPVYAFWMFYFMIFLTEKVNFSPIPLISNLLLIQNWGLASPYVGPSWSVSVELATYLAFPFLCMSIFNRGKWFTLLAVTMSLFILVILAYSKELSIDWLQHGYSGRMDIIAYNNVGPVLRCLAGFTLGVVSWKLFDYMQKSFNTAQANITTLVISVAIIISLSEVGFDVLTIVLFSLLIPSIGAKGSIISKLLSCKPIYFLGVISYSMYISHIIILALYKGYVNEFVSFAIKNAQYRSDASTFLSLLMIIAVATLSYYAVEKPTRKLLRTSNKFVVATA
ncbi:TPA: acyltransferase [Escherichia coli]|uniref:acyltransferase family protein n=1 Tax=Escherichia coli TaxID=562 RepID=UPI001C167119|nr:acyltransferase [Escherichia coli]HBE5017529.1 acyltransferase [Escherichia coli]HCB3052946.1 acyltransferase [Escherichia coli]